MSLTPTQLPSELLDLEQRTRMGRVPVRTHVSADINETFDEIAKQAIASSIWRKDPRSFMSIMIGEEFAPLLFDAYFSMPVSGFLLEDLPAPSGAVYLNYGADNDYPGIKDGELILAWRHVPPEELDAETERKGYPNGFLLLQPFEKRNTDTEFALSDVVTISYNNEPPISANYLGGKTIATPQEDGDTLAEEHFGIMVVLSLLLQQPGTDNLLTRTSVEADRSTRKRYRHHDREAPQVRVINLRYPVGDSDKPGHDYHHRWVVRGHWRHQWYPSIEAHRPVYIAPHVKGPKDAPLLGGSKVYQVVR